MKAGKDRALAQGLSSASLSDGDGTGWFDRLYTQAAGRTQLVPWAELEPNPVLTRLLEGQGVAPGTRALVVGCGLGDDAEALAAHGAEVTAFDISPAAVEWARKRFPGSCVDYQVADLLDLPSAWLDTFDFIFEAYTLQAVPRAVRDLAVPCLPGLLAPGGRLLIVCRGGDDDQDQDGPPWKLSWGQLAPCLEAGLVLERFHDFLDDEDPPVRRFHLSLLRRSVPAPPEIPDAHRETVDALERIQARLWVVRRHLLDLDGYERWGNPTRQERDAAFLATGVEPGEELQLCSDREQRVARARALNPDALTTWALAHIHLLEHRLAGFDPHSDSTARYVCAEERRAWTAFVIAGGAPDANVGYVRYDPVQYETVFAFPQAT